MISHSHIHRGSRDGFSLIELLAVTAILGLLAALAIPAAGQAIMVAKRSACASNLRQVGLSILLYADDHSNRLPPTTHSSGADYESAWIYALRPYTNSFDSIRICPADPLGEKRMVHGGTSYILNNIVADPQYGPFGEPLRSYNNLLQLAQPSRTLVACIISETRTGTGTQNDHTHAEGWDAGWSAFIRDVEANRHRSGGSNGAHTNGSSNYLFADGHVESIPAEQLKERFDAGENFARPPEN